VFSSDDKLVVRFTMTGVHNGEFMGVPRDRQGDRAARDHDLHFADGRCVERWSSAHMLGVLVQLGAVPPPA